MHPGFYVRYWLRNAIYYAIDGYTFLRIHCLGSGTVSVISSRMKAGNLFPLYRRGGLAGDVVCYAVDSWDFGDYAT